MQILQPYNKPPKQSYEEEQFQLIGQPQIRKHHQVCSSNKPEYDESMFLVLHGRGDPKLTHLGKAMWVWA